MMNYSKLVQKELSKINKSELINKYSDKKIAMVISMLYNNLSNCFVPIDLSAFVNHIGSELWLYFWNYFIDNSSEKLFPDTAFLIKQLFYDTLKNNGNIELDKLITTRLTDNTKALSFVLPASINKPIKLYSKNELIDEVKVTRNGFEINYETSRQIHHTLMVSETTIPRHHTFMMSETTIPRHHTYMVSETTKYPSTIRYEYNPSDFTSYTGLDDESHVDYKYDRFMTNMKSEATRPIRFMTNMSSRATTERFMTNMSSSATYY